MMNPIFDDLYRAIGTICVHATWLEHELEDTVVEIVGGEGIELVIRGQRGSNTINVIRRLLKENAVGSSEQTLLSAILKRAEMALEKRDQVVHSVWIVTNTTAPGHVRGTRTKASGSVSTDWSLKALEDVRVALEQIKLDLMVVSHNAVARKRGYGRLPPDNPAQGA